MSFHRARWLLATLSLFCGFAAAADTTPKKTIGVLIYDKVLTSDVTAPLEVLGNAVKHAELSGYRVVTIAPERKLITTEEGLMLMPQFGIDDAPELAALIVGSAYDMDPVLANSKLINWVQHRGQSVNWLASNCSGARILGDAGLLTGRTATTYPGGELTMKLRYPRSTIIFGEKVVVDRNLVTSNGGLVSYPAAFKLLELMTSKTFADVVAAEIYFDRIAANPTAKVSEAALLASTNTENPKVTQLLTQDIIGVRGKSVEMLTVEYPPGGSSPSHRHDANVFVYMLHGTMAMQLAGQKEITLGTGQTFYESPTDVHTKSANASQTTPAKFLVVKIVDKK